MRNIDLYSKFKIHNFKLKKNINDYIYRFYNIYLILFIYLINLIEGYGSIYFFHFNANIIGKKYMLIFLKDFIIF